MMERLGLLLARCATPCNVRVSLVVISVLLMALAGGAPGVGGGTGGGGG